MGSLIETDKRTARKKGMTAAAIAGGSVVGWWIAGPVLGLVGLAGAAYLTVDWFMYRAKRGMRF